MVENIVEKFFRLKAVSLEARARQIIRLTPATVGLREEDTPFAPSPAHFRAARAELEKVERSILRRLGQARAARVSGLPRSPEDRLLGMAMVERDVDRARRLFGLFFEIFAQRGTAYGPALAAYDVIGVDCYRASISRLPGVLGPALTPVCYLEHGYSPATVRRGISIARLLGDSLPFPVIRIPWDRDKPWQATFLHEVAHNLQADMGIWEETQQGVYRRFIEGRFHPNVTGTFGRWHKETFADITALLLGGPATAFGMAEFLAHPADKVMTFRPGGAHPTSYVRVLMMAEMLDRMGFRTDGAQLRRIWQTLYDPKRGHRLPEWLLAALDKAVPAMVDEIAFQPRRNLAEQALASVIRFSAADQTAIRRAAFDLKAGRPPTDLAPRHVVSACRYALEAGAPPEALGHLIIDHLSHRKRPDDGLGRPRRDAPRPELLTAA